MAFGLDHTHKYSQRGRRGSGLEGLALHPLHPCGQLTRCFSAVAELVVIIVLSCLTWVSKLCCCYFLCFTAGSVVVIIEQMAGVGVVSCGVMLLSRH